MKPCPPPYFPRYEMPNSRCSPTRGGAGGHTLLHGNSRAARLFGWVPLSRGAQGRAADSAATAPPPGTGDFPWSLDVVIDEFVNLMNAGLERFHMVAPRSRA